MKAGKRWYIFEFFPQFQTIVLRSFLTLKQQRIPTFKVELRCLFFASFHFKPGSASPSRGQYITYSICWKPLLFGTDCE